MKKLLISLLFVVSSFASQHGKTTDPALQQALQGHYKKAFKMFDQRCQKNDAYACGMVGYFYNKGFGVIQDTKKAVKFYEKGCKLNDSDSCTFLAYFYAKGQMNLPQNTQKAIKLLNKACKLGNQNACKYLDKIK